MLVSGESHRIVNEIEMARAVAPDFEPLGLTGRANRPRMLADLNLADLFDVTVPSLLYFLLELRHGRHVFVGRVSHLEIGPEIHSLVPAFYIFQREVHRCMNVRETEISLRCSFPQNLGDQASVIVRVIVINIRLVGNQDQTFGREQPQPFLRVAYLPVRIANQSVCRRFSAI